MDRRREVSLLGCSWLFDLGRELWLTARFKASGVLFRVGSGAGLDQDGRHARVSGLPALGAYRRRRRPIP